MKIFLLTIFTFLYTHAFANDIVINQNNIVLIYEANAEYPLSSLEIIKLTSEEYMNAENEFTKKNLLIKNKPILKNKLLKFKNIHNFTAKLSTYLGDYDFDNNGFKLKINNTIYLPYHNLYRVNFENASDFNFFQIKPNKAEKLVQKHHNLSLTKKNRNVIIEFHGILTKADEERYGDMHESSFYKGQVLTTIKNIKTVKLFATKAVIYSASGEFIKTINSKINYDDFIKLKNKDKKCADVDKVFNIGLHTTVDEVKHSISCGANIRKRSKGWFGFTPLQWAKEFKNIPVIRFLEKELKKTKQ